MMNNGIEFTSFFLVRSSREFCDSVLIRLTVASRVSLHAIVRLICVSRIDRSNADDSVRSTFEPDRDELINDESVGRNPANID